MVKPILRRTYLWVTDLVEVDACVSSSLYLFSSAAAAITTETTAAAVTTSAAINSGATYRKRGGAPSGSTGPVLPNEPCTCKKRRPQNA